MATRTSTREIPTAEQVAALFNPRAIALVGATDKSKWSSNIFGNLREFGFPGNVYLVNPRGGLIHEEKAYAEIADLPDDVEMAFVMVPPGVVLEVLEKLSAHNIRSAVLLTSGFGEVGEEGAQLEADVVASAREKGMTLLGPNGNGYINASALITPFGLPISGPLLNGGVGIVLQSGALASAVLNQAQSRNVGISLMVAMGNESMLSMTDVVRYLINDPNTRVITLFVESVRQPDEFRAAAFEALRAGKPIVAMKVGTSRTGARVARAHTGSLVGDDTVIEAVFRQSGVIRVESLEDLIITAGLMAVAPVLASERMGFITASGGACEIIADRAEVVGIEIPEFTSATVQKLAAVAPEFASPQNPVDLTGYVLIDDNLFRNGLTAIKDDPGIDSIVAMLELPRIDDGTFDLAVERLSTTATLVRSVEKPVFMISGTATDITPYGRAVAEASGFPHVLGGLHHGVTALGNLARWSRSHRELIEPREQVTHATEFVFAAEPVGLWSEHVAAAFLAENGVPVVPQELVGTADAAVESAERLGYPVVLKVSADNLGHKSDIGGVKLNLTDAESVRTAFRDVVAAGRDADALVKGALVQPQRSGGVELIVGVVTDPVWGQVLAVGLGGIWVEILKDSVLNVLPVDRKEIRQSLSRLRGAKLLDGARGTEPVNIDALVDVIDNVAHLAMRLGDKLDSLELNPLLALGDRVEALDALITWSTE